MMAFVACMKETECRELPAFRLRNAPLPGLSCTSANGKPSSPDLEQSVTDIRRKISGNFVEALAVLKGRGIRLADGFC